MEEETRKDDNRQSTTLRGKSGRRCGRCGDHPAKTVFSCYDAAENAR